jgi:hypothetical protein
MWEKQFKIKQTTFFKESDRGEGRKGREKP